MACADACAASSLCMSAVLNFKFDSSHLEGFEFFRQCQHITQRQYRLLPQSADCGTAERSFCCDPKWPLIRIGQHRSRIRIKTYLQRMNRLLGETFPRCYNAQRCRNISLSPVLSQFAMQNLLFTLPAWKSGSFYFLGLQFGETCWLIFNKSATCTRLVEPSRHT